MRSIFILLYLLIYTTFVSGTGIAETGLKADSERKAVSLITPDVPAQARVLIEITTAFVHGSISAEQAVNLREAVYRVGEQADSYLAQGKAIPAAVVQSEIKRFDDFRLLLQHFEQSAQIHKISGSAVLQDQVKSEVRQCLALGKISANQGSDLKNKVNSICTEEAWYLSTGSRSIPGKVLQGDVKELSHLHGQLRNLLATQTATL